MKMKINLSLSDRGIKYSSLFLEKIPSFVTLHRLKIIIFYCLLTSFFVAGVPKFTINQSMDAFFAKEDMTMKRYQWFRYVFGSDEFVMVMYQPKDGDVFSDKSLKALTEIEKKLNAGKDDPDSPLNRITRVRSILSADYLENSDDSLINRPFIGKNLPKNEAEREALRKLASEHKDYPEAFFSKDFLTGTIMIETDYGTRIKGAKVESTENNSTIGEEDEFDFGEGDFLEKRSELIKIEDIPELEEVPMDGYSELVNGLKNVFNDPSFKEHNKIYYAGNPWIMTFFEEVIMKEMGIVAGFSLLIIWIVTTFAFRSLSALVWPTLTLVTGEVWTIGLIGWTGIEMTFMINIIVFLLLAVSMAISIHIMSSYSYYVTHGSSKSESVSLTYKACGVPIILAAITTAVGLISLFFVPILAIKNFGLFAAMGVLLTMTANLLMWPVLFSIWAPNIKEKQYKKDSLLTKFLWSQKNRTMKNEKKIVFFFIVVSLIAMSGIPKVYIDTNFIEMVKDGFGIKESYTVIDKNFGGTATFELLLDTGKQDGVKDPDLLNGIDSFLQEILEKHGDIVVRTRSIVNATKDSHKNMTDGTEKNYKIPDTKDKVSQILISFESADPATRKMIVDDNWQVARLTLSVVTKGTQVYGDLVGKIDKIAAKHFNPLKKTIPNLKLIHSGGMRLMIDLINLISISQIKSFSLALVVISILIFFLLGSVKFGILAMIPNLFPIVAIMGYAGWMGIPMDSDTLLVLPIAIGIAVDDTIHFLTHYKTELINGKTSDEAIDSSLKKVGQAMVFTSVVLTSGFLIFVFSAYIPLTNFGVLSGIAIFSALLADLFLLPVLIEIFKPFSTESSLSKKSATITVLGIVLIFFLIPKSSYATEKNAIKIAKKMIDRDDGSSMYSKSLLISCEFKEIKGKRKCIAGKRKKVFEGLTKDLDASGNITRSLTLINEPVSEKGVAFLQEDYKEDGKDSEQWIYMPALKKLKRIVSSDNGPKTGTLFGSEIAYEDIEKLHLSDHTYLMLREEKIMGLDVWVIKMIPTAKRRPKSSYSKIVQYIDKKSYIPIKSEMYDKRERLAKTFINRKLIKIKEVWVARQLIVVNHKNNRMSMMKNMDIKMNIDFSDDLMSTRALNDLDYRERNLKKMRN